jgi:hypothetical protein
MAARNKIVQRDENEISDSYFGKMTATASNRRYLDIEPNITVRDSYNRDDYYHFRPNENVDGETKRLIKRSADAYESVGLIKQIIDLMGDFASQGARICHTNKNIERFYRRWWQKVNGSERSERFLNLLYRLGNVVVYKTNGKITKKEQKNMSKAASREIPFRYDFLNPINVEVDSDFADIFEDNKSYRLRVPQRFRDAAKNKKKLKSSYSSKLDKEFIPLERERLAVYHYKKDDWSLWANPMIHAILDDITMFEKFKLADMSALDGAISNIRLWNIGDLEHKILPTKAAIERLRDILATNVGGGTMDLVWGPELKFTESNTQIYKFLGNEKYGPVYNSIYSGLGVPQTLTGASSSGGFTNNFLSLKTLIEKLEYGRNLIIDFWTKEFEAVAKAMGFPSAAEITFEHMILSDEAAEKNLWIQLYDRNIISIETLRERFGETDPLETSRIESEYKGRKKGKIPPKSDPYHNGDVEHEYIKLALQKDTLSIEDVTDYKARQPPVVPTGTGPAKKKPSGQNGRPKFTKDSGPRKQRRVLPKSKASLAQVIVWATEAQKKISAVLNPVMLAQYGKSSLRELTTAEQDELEEIKYVALCGLEQFCDVNEESIATAMSKKERVDYLSFYKNFLKTSGRQPTLEEKRQLCCLAYSCREF